MAASKRVPCSGETVGFFNGEKVSLLAGRSGEIRWRGESIGARSLASTAVVS